MKNQQGVLYEQKRIHRRKPKSGPVEPRMKATVESATLTTFWKYSVFSKYEINLDLELTF